MDRNYIIKITGNTPAASLSARRAWIEISIDDLEPSSTRSLSARRAWIEIQNDGPSFSVREVALRKESVDRNLAVWAVEHAYQRRSPQGERG